MIYYDNNCNEMENVPEDFRAVGTVEDLLIYLLVKMNASQDETVAIMSFLRTPLPRWELVQWIARHRQADMQEVIGKAMEIYQKTQEQEEQGPA